MRAQFASFTVDLDRAASGLWDAVVIGSGMGGSSTAYQLTRRGMKVLLIEKGRHDLDNTRFKGFDVETEDADDRLAEGRWPTQIAATINGQRSQFWAPLGCGLGGSTQLYAAALSRLEPLDFEHRTAPDGTAIGWPLSYSDIEPYYEDAERLFQVSGTQNPLSEQRPFPLRNPPAMSALDQQFFQSFASNGLHPYRLHIGQKSVPGCVGCGGHVCIKTGCKQDAAQSCLIPAVQTGNLSILDRASVEKLTAIEDRVESVRVRKSGVVVEIRAKCFVLAAGAYFSPAILMRSTSSSWPKGIGNQAGLVGRNLMFHVSEYIAIWPRNKFSAEGMRSTIAFRDLYEVDGKKFGEMQSTGIVAGYGSILYYLRSVLDQSRFRRIPMLRQLLRIPAYIGARIFADATVFACILEDFPYRENRIVIDDDTDAGIRVEYSINEELRSRTVEFRRILRQRLKPNRMFPMNDSVTLNYGHPCGTCISGNDANSSVVGADGKVHGIRNLYITDASTMATSGGANPSLTIAANALRVGKVIVSRFNERCSADAA